MKKKNIKKMIAPLSAIISLGVGTHLGLDNVVELEKSISAVLTGVITIAGVLGVWANNDK